MKDFIINFASEIKCPLEARDSSAVFKEFVIIFEFPSRIVVRNSISSKNSIALDHGYQGILSIYVN